MLLQDDGYKNKGCEYFNNVRLDIVSLLPPHVDRIFEVGCGEGNTLSYLKAIGACNWCGGIELFHSAAQHARAKLDLLLEGSVEELTMMIDNDSMDVILCLDVLEHLRDPWQVIFELSAKIKPGGLLICSIPNVRHFSVLLPLLLFGRWRYKNHGILDSTHLRFFTKESAIELVEYSGCRIEKILATDLDVWSKAKVANFISLGFFRRMFELQYLIKAKKPND
jgi:2-polyprenyl-3-methyl-5-hydroxy-6-metoxy-1,4-benzoquinol methylase